MRDPIYIPEAHVAKMLGHGIDWFHKNVEMLERQYGFPKVDPAIRRRHRPSIEKWAEERNSRLSPRSPVDVDDDKEDWDAF